MWQVGKGRLASGWQCDLPWMAGAILRLWAKAGHDQQWNSAFFGMSENAKKGRIRAMAVCLCYSMALG